MVGINTPDILLFHEAIITAISKPCFLSFRVRNACRYYDGTSNSIYLRVDKQFFWQRKYSLQCMMLQYLAL